ncbi:extracellular solute-binding protein [Shimia sp. R9_3]|uniref:extracellular solute-binding protein n=1 Tax=Shimia sp. R9_3 TaxID=2821113 RepID=UPI001ADA1E21|nr:extracellular solute-binding protein [Shimia sp. R9_3]MBO9400958.1 extracellular solute-binding protein [Shimia sp. R9_3]
MTFKHFLRPLGLAATVCLGATALKAGEDLAWLYTWRASTPDAFSESFVKEHPEGLVIDTFMVPDEAEARLAAQNTGYDVSVLPAEIVKRLADMDALMPIDTPVAIDWEAAPASASVAQTDALSRVADYYVPYVWGTTGLVMDVEAIRARLPDAPLDSWDLLFDPQNAAALSDCGISIIDSPQEIFSLALHHLGRDPHGVTTEDFDAGFAALKEIMPHVRRVSYKQLEEMSSGDTCLGLVWSTVGLTLAKHAPKSNYTYVVPKEGSLIWSNVLVAPRSEEADAHRGELLAHIVSKENAETLANYVQAILSPKTFTGDMSTEQAAIAQASLPEGRDDLMFALRPLSGPKKYALDKRWRRLLIGQ